MLISQFLQEFHQELPLSLAMADDPVGVQILVEDRPLTNVAVAYELDEPTIERAIQANAELIVAFHPLIYPSLKRITGATRVERCVARLITERMGLLIVHTAFDAHPNGTSALFAQALGCANIAPLQPVAILPNGGMGAIGTLEHPLTLEELAKQVCGVCKVPTVRVSVPAGSRADAVVRRVGVLGGSGMSFYDSAVHAGADVFITADVRYHGFHSANDRIPVIDPGHFETEIFVVDGVARLLQTTVERTGAAIAVHPLRQGTSPVRYLS
ncbi:MAG: Nif3-like dinuclear metal center hexameric protein [Chlorobi bacterium CHB2]|nr:Nif3-like dinuclear metal center hexameric protein [Chlorobi bacterium CHB2]